MIFRKTPVPGSPSLFLCTRSLMLISSHFFHPIPSFLSLVGSASEQIAWAPAGGAWVQSPASSGDQDRDIFSEAPVCWVGAGQLLRRA